MSRMRLYELDTHEAAALGIAWTGAGHRACAGCAESEAPASFRRQQTPCVVGRL